MVDVFPARARRRVGRTAAGHPRALSPRRHGHRRPARLPAGARRTEQTLRGDAARARVRARRDRLDVGTRQGRGDSWTQDLGALQSGTFPPPLPRADRPVALAHRLLDAVHVVRRGRGPGRQRGRRAAHGDACPSRCRTASATRGCSDKTPPPTASRPPRRCPVPSRRLAEARCSWRRRAPKRRRGRGRTSRARPRPSCSIPSPADGSMPTCRRSSTARRTRSWLLPPRAGGSRSASGCVTWGRRRCGRCRRPASASSGATTARSRARSRSRSFPPWPRSRRSSASCCGADASCGRGRADAPLGPPYSGTTSLSAAASAGNFHS